MNVRVRLFARARDLAGSATVEVDVPAAATVGDVRRCLAEARPALAGLLAHSALAINDAFADDAQIVPLGAEIALLPPVSGG